jgi:hypothetical protein
MPECDLPPWCPDRAQAKLGAAATRATTTTMAQTDVLAVRMAVLELKGTPGGQHGQVMRGRHHHRPLLQRGPLLARCCGQVLCRPTCAGLRLIGRRHLDG